MVDNNVPQAKPSRAGPHGALMKPLLRFTRIFMVSAFALAANSLIVAQTASTFSPSGADHSFMITTPTAEWTDTGLDLKTGDVVQISDVAVTGCGPQASDAATQPSSLPLPSAPAGSLLARLHAQGAEPLLAEAGKDIHIKEASHLFLGVNGGNCAGSMQVKVHVISAAGAAPKDIKSKLAAAAETWLAGQFGSGASSAPAPGNGETSGTANTLPALKVSDTPLDSALRKSINNLPRRVHDQFTNQGDMVNFVLVGSETQMQAALQAASWNVADTDDREAALKAVLETYQKKDYLAMPMSTLYLFDRRQDFGYEEADPYAVVATRHHFRIWKAPFTYKNETVWVGAGTHDIGFERDQRNGKVTHKIDPAVDGERDNIGQTLQEAGKVTSMSYYLPPDPVQDARNATGGGYHSDGRILVVFLQ
jgi:hypothetical protein